MAGGEMTGWSARGRRVGTPARAVGAFALAATSMFGFPQAGAPPWTGLARTSAARTGVASGGGGGTTPADNSQCTKNDSKPEPDQSATPWEVSYANAQASTQSGNGSGVKVAIIDTGVAGGVNQVSKPVVGGQDLTGGGGQYKADVDGHGTFVASIIAAQQTGRNGMVGLAPGAKLLIYREAGCNVSGGNDEKSMAQAIDAAVAAHAKVINISQEGYDPDDTLKNAVMNAYQNNVLIVAAAGNFGNSDAIDPRDNSDHGINPMLYPAAYAPYLITVGAATRDGGVADFSETGADIGITAPGEKVGGLFPDGKIHLDSGTSFAAPYVAGLAALLIAKHPDWPVSTVMRVLESTANGNGSWNKSSGWGEVDASAALTADPAHLTKLYGAGPNADGPAQAKPVTHGIPMLPIVDAAPPQMAVDQRKGAYIALGSALLIAVVLVAGTVVARDARRRRMLP
ncbi:S8 family serine peptidase [Actinocrinis puniceicyclus]|uniref:S8 family serine peptidase n=1 Tax=Actinocrinis puniceicyclus TaxID=977794 RepID=A0A8J7WMY1_9ACTN|nr:S8 family serine peptidase [Actinocrinis puniceicyclus]MBS2965326.1 S8 family serine peptidase [Actinocrinis puniceicyclus]